MKLVAYTIGGQTIGIDIQTWNNAMLSGNTAFLAIADSGSTPTDYVDISSIVYWDQFGNMTTLSLDEIKTEITKLIPVTPTPEEREIFLDWGIYIVTDDISGVTEGRFDTCRVEGKLYADWLKNMHTASRASVMRIDDTDPLAGTNIGGMVILNPGGGNPYGSGETQYWIGVDSGGITRAGFDGDFKALLNGASNIGTGEGLATVANETELEIKSLKAGTNITLTPDATSVTITSTGSGGGLYGTEYQFQSSLAESSSASDTPVVKTTLTTTDLPSGTYKITLGWIGRGNAQTNDILFDVTLNGTPQGTTTTMNIEPKDGTNYVPYARIFYLSLSGVNDIALRYWSENTNQVGISDATIELIRVE